jgi:hypothetical protein
MRVQSWIGRRPAGRPGISVRLGVAAIVAAAGTAAPAVASTRGDLARAQRDAHVEARRVSDTALRARISVDWAAGVTGGWFDPARWSGGVVPQNDGVDEYDATIAAPGLYTVLINGDAHVSTLAMTAADATLELFSGSLTVDEAFTLSNGAFRLRDGVATLGSVNLTSGLFDIDGGVLEVGGVLRSAGATLRFDAGTIRNTVYDGDDTRLLITGRTGRTFDNVTITDGALTLGATQGLRIVNGLQTVNGGGVLLDGGLLEFGGTQTLTGVDLQATIASGNEFRVIAGAALTIGADMNLSGAGFRLTAAAGGSLINYGTIASNAFLTSGGALVNHGAINDATIEWDAWENHGLLAGSAVLRGSGVNYGTIEDTFLDGAWTNEGLIHFNPGDSAFVRGVWTNNGDMTGVRRLDGNWVNTGSIAVADGQQLRLEGAWFNAGVIHAENASVLFADDFATASIGDLRVAGSEVSLPVAWNNAGASFAIPEFSNWTVSGSVTGGAIDGRLAPLTVNGGASIDNVAYLGDLIVGPEAFNTGTQIGEGLQISEGALFVPQFAKARFIDGVISNMTVEMNRGAIQTGVGNTLLVDQQSQIRGDYGNVVGASFASPGSFTNEGAINVGVRFNVAESITSATNNGVWSVLDGAELRVDRGAFHNAGVMTLHPGAAALLGVPGSNPRFVDFQNSGFLSIDPGATLTVVGSATLTNSSMLRIALADSMTRDGAIMAITGDALIDGSLSMTLVDPLALPLGTRIALMQATGAVTGEFDELFLPTMANGLTFAAEYTGSGVDLVVVIPTPNTAALFALTGLAAARRRRR